MIEQDRIEAEARRLESEIGRLIDTEVREIALIQEFRTRMIADVITGKLDVRAQLIRPAFGSIGHLKAYPSESGLPRCGV